MGTKIIFYISKVCSPQVFLIRSKKVVSKFRTRERKKSKRMFNHNLLLDCSAPPACVTYGKSKNKTFLFSLSFDIGETETVSKYIFGKIEKIGFC